MKKTKIILLAAAVLATLCAVTAGWLRAFWDTLSVTKERPLPASSETVYYAPLEPEEPEETASPTEPPETVPEQTETQPETEPATEPETEAATEPSTEPETVPETIPESEPEPDTAEKSPGAWIPWLLGILAVVLAIGIWQMLSYKPQHAKKRKK